MTGSLTVYCRCGKPIAVPAKHRGKRIKCKQCGREMRVGIAVLFPPLVATILTALSLAYLAAICALAIVMWGLGDVWWPGTVLLFMGRWIFLLPLAVLIPAALIIRRRLVVPLLLAAAICVGPVMGFRTGWRRMLPHPAGTHVRILTYNVDGGDIVAPRLASLLAETRPDFVALQECGDDIAITASRLPGWFYHRDLELCFLSRYALRDSAVMDRRILDRLNQSDADIGGSGYVVRYTVQMPQGEINVTNLHLETPRKGLEGLLDRSFEFSKLAANTELRGIESELASRWVHAGTAPSLVAGDFNTPVESRIFQKSWGSMTDAFSRAGFGFGATRMSGWIRVRIDHVLNGPGWYADHAEVGPDFGSDHLPLIVDLTLVKN